MKATNGRELNVEIARRADHRVQGQVKEPSKKDGKMMKTFQRDGVKKSMKQGQKAGKKKPGANIAYWLPWWKRMEREAEKSRDGLKEIKISKYLQPISSSPRVVCSSEDRKEETDPVQVEIPEGSSSYDKTEKMSVAKERPQRAVPASVSTPKPKLKPHSFSKGRKRGRNLDFERVVESPAKKNTFDVDLKNHGSGQIGVHLDNCCRTKIEEKVKGLT